MATYSFTRNSDGVSYSVNGSFSATVPFGFKSINATSDKVVYLYTGRFNQRLLITDTITINEQLFSGTTTQLVDALRAVFTDDVSSGGTGVRKVVGNENYTILSSQKHIATSVAFTAPRTWTLPAANSVSAGYELIVIDEVGAVSATNTLTIQRAGTDSLNGGTTEVMSTAYGFRRLISNGTNKWNLDAGIMRLGQVSTYGLARQILVSNVPLSVTGTTVETTVFTGTILANTIGVNGRFHFIFSYSMTNNANAKTIRLKVNGNTIAASSPGGVASYRLYSMLVNRNSLSVQMISGASGSASAVGFNAGSGVAPTTFAINTGADVTVTVTLQLAVSTDTAALEDFQTLAIS